jgi:ATP-binding cassette subfamily G (WHITE) protein 2 (PDR)
MGVTGAGKTTLLDCLADRATIGVVSGEILVNGHPRGASFQKKTGYVQQQYLYLATATVREALQFTAIMRQPGHLSRAEKLAYVDVLEMHAFADAVIGNAKESLNIEQRKRLTIAVEMVAKPELLLFLGKSSDLQILSTRS